MACIRLIAIVLFVSIQCEALADDFRWMTDEQKQTIEQITELSRTDPNQSKQLAEQQLTSTSPTRLSEYRMRLIAQLAWAHYLLGEHDVYNDHNAQLLKEARAFGNPFAIAYALSQYASAQYVAGKYQQALVSIYQALKITEPEQQQRFKSIEFNLNVLLSSIHQQANLPDQAIAFFDRATELANQFGFEQSALQFNLAIYYNAIERPSQAIQAAQRLRQNPLFANDRRLQLGYFMALGNAYIGLQRYADAEQAFIQGIRVAESYQMREGLFRVYNNMVDLAIEQNKDSLVRQLNAYLDQHFSTNLSPEIAVLYHWSKSKICLYQKQLVCSATHLATAFSGQQGAIKDSLMAGLYETQIKLNEQQQDYQSALKWHKILSELQLEKNRLNRLAISDVLAANFELRTKDAQLAKHELQQAQQRKTLIIIIALALILIMGLLFMLQRSKQRNRVLLAAAESKNDFFASIIHDVRSPLHGIMAASDLIDERCLDKESASFLTAIKQSANTLLELVSDLMDVSKDEARRLTLDVERFNLHQLLQQLIGHFQQIYQSEQLAIQLDINSKVPEEVEGDSVKLKRLLTNLLSNSIKFTERGSVKLSVFLQYQDQSMLRLNFSVADTGLGMSTKQIQRLFTPYDQTRRDIAKRFGGTGLGLAICKRFAELMEGEIIVSSEPNKGTEFSVSLPLQSVTESQKPQPTQTVSLQIKQQLKALVVEDNIVNRKILLHILHKLGFDTLNATNGEEALEILQQNSFDLVFTDDHMPKVTGSELIAIMQKHPNWSKLPVIGLSGDEQAFSQVRSPQIIGLIRKPFTFNDVKQLLHQLGIIEECLLAN